MSETTIQIPAEHVEAIRQGLTGRRGDARHAKEIEACWARSRVAPRAAPHALTGSRAVLWGAVYDALCAAAERLAEDCNEYWRGAVDPGAARAAVTGVAARLELLVGLGAPPAASRSQLAFRGFRSVEHEHEPGHQLRAQDAGSSAGVALLGRLGDHVRHPAEHSVDRDLRHDPGRSSAVACSISVPTQSSVSRWSRRDAGVAAAISINDRLASAGSRAKSSRPQSNSARKADRQSSCSATAGPGAGGDPLDDRPVRLEQDVLLAREVRVERLSGHAGLGRDLVDGRRRVAATRHHASHSGEQPLALRVNDELGRQPVAAAGSLLVRSLRSRRARTPSRRTYSAPYAGTRFDLSKTTIDVGVSQCRDAIVEDPRPGCLASCNSRRATMPR